MNTAIDVMTTQHGRSKLPTDWTSTVNLSNPKEVRRVARMLMLYSWLTLTEFVTIQDATTGDVVPDDVRGVLEEKLRKATESEEP